ncbi:response regulator [Gordonia sp. ABKF26]|uniref:response regulator n=1 Tax=Gordonia sp. ABKF26 TaxID=3238687 RepID=UPI0034E3A001
MVSVFLVDDHEISRLGVISSLGSDSDLLVAGEAATFRQAVARIPAVSPDIVVLETELPDGSGIDLCRMLVGSAVGVKCFMLTSATDAPTVVDSVLAGASGYVGKDITGVDLAAAIADVGAGRFVLDERAVEALIGHIRVLSRQPRGPFDDLTEQNRTLLLLLGEGLTNRQIALRMHLAEKTVKNYVSRLLQTLGMQRRAQAAVYATSLLDTHLRREG